MTDEQLMAIRDRHGRASRGEWQPTGDFGTHLEGQTPDGTRAVVQVFADRQADAVFLASAHEDMGALLVEVERLQRLLAQALVSVRYAAEGTNVHAELASRIVQRIEAALEIED